MSDESKPSSPSDEMENQDLPEPSVEEPTENRPKKKRTGKSSRRRSTKDEPQEQQIESPEEQPQFDEDELLADVRRSLIEEEEASKSKPGWRKIFRRKTKTTEPEPSSLKEELKIEAAKTEKEDEIPLAESESDTIAESPTSASEEVDLQETEVDESSKLDAQIENLFTMLEEGEAAKPAPGEAPETALVERPKDEAPSELKEEVAREAKGREVLRVQSAEEKAEETIDSLREVALEDYSVEPLQPEEAEAVTGRQRLRIFIAGLKPVERFVLIGAAGIMILAGIFGTALMVRNSQAVEVVPTSVGDTPYPTGVSLPGGWEFYLNRGKVEDGKWNPTGPEWLEGTELCKWVALPWSLQLEAVLHTLEKDDPIDLIMSNTDHLTFRVQSLREVSVDQVSALEQKSPCLLLILVNPDSDTRLVLTAVP